MNAILALLNDWRETTSFALALPYLRLLFAGLWAFALVTAVAPDVALAAIRSALRRAGISDKAFASDACISAGLASVKLHGGRPITVQTLTTQPREFWQWWAVEIVTLVGVPVEVTAGARLARRQARMQLNEKKAGVA